METMVDVDNPYRRFAVEAHGDQQYGDVPYVVHLDAVVEIVRTYVDVDEAIGTAYLHDVLEDTDVTYDELREHVGAAIASQVLLVTDPVGPNRKSRKAKLNGQLRAADRVRFRWALLVKAADRLANVRSCVAEKRTKLFDLYKSEHADFRAACLASCNTSIFEEIDRIFNVDAARSVKAGT